MTDAHPEAHPASFPAGNTSFAADAPGSLSLLGLQQRSLVRIVDDDEGLRVSYRFLLEGEGWLVRSYASAEAFLEEDCPFVPGCIVLDVRMPGMSGLELQRLLLERALCPRIVFVSAHGTVPMAVKAMKDGAADFLTKPVDERVLVETIEAAVRRDLAERAAHEQQASAARAWRRLSVREAQVAAEVVRGRPNKQIADLLGISERTVQQHRTSLYRKLEVSSSAELATLAGRAGLIR